MYDLTLPRAFFFFLVDLNNDIIVTNSPLVRKICLLCTYFNENKNKKKSTHSSFKKKIMSSSELQQQQDLSFPNTSRRVVAIVIAIGAVIFLISISSPPPSIHILQAGNGDFVRDVPRSQPQPPSKPSPPVSSTSRGDDDDTPSSSSFWARGTGGRVSPNFSKGAQQQQKQGSGDEPSPSSSSAAAAAGPSCSVRPAAPDTKGWTVHCPCATSSSPSSVLDFTVEFAAPFTKLVGTKCSHYLRSRFATADISSKKKIISCDSKSLQVTSLTSPSTSQIRVVISNLQQQKDLVCGIIRNSTSTSDNSNNNDGDNNDSTRNVKKIDAALMFVTEVDFKLSTDRQKTEWKTCFAAIGDWGRYQKSSVDTANLLEAVLEKRPEVKFVVSTGDNFYPVGVQSVDDPQFKNVFEKLYSGKFTRSLMWVQSLGNHDWWRPAEPQINYGKMRSDRWYLPQTTYGVTFPVPGDDGNDAAADARMYIIDPYGKAASVDKQLLLMKKYFEEGVGAGAGVGAATARVKSNPRKFWKIVVGHQPIYSGANHGQEQRVISQRRKYNAAFRSAKVNAYLNGDDHLLEVHRKSFALQQQSSLSSENSRESQQQQQDDEQAAEKQEDQPQSPSQQKKHIIDYLTTGAGGGSGAYGSKLLATSYLSFPHSVGFTVHCFGNQFGPQQGEYEPEQFMKTEFHFVSKPAIQGSVKDDKDSRKDVPVIKTPLTC